MDLGSFVETYRKDNLELIPLLREIGLLKPITYFVCCEGTPMTESVIQQEGHSGYLQYKCDNCGEKKLATVGSVFHHCQLTYYCVVLLIKCFVLEMNLPQAMQVAQLNYTTVSQIYNTCWNVCAKFLSKYPIKIGGNGDICELQEVQLGKKKKQPKEENVLYFGMDTWCIIVSERRRKISYLFFAKKKTRDTVYPHIKEHVEAGTSIVAEEGEIYDGLIEEGYHFSKVNFAEEGTDLPSDWGKNLAGPVLAHFKAMMRRRGWAGLNTLQDYINEYMFRGMLLNYLSEGEDMFLKFCSVVQEVY